MLLKNVNCKIDMIELVTFSASEIPVAGSSVVTTVQHLKSAT